MPSFEDYASATIRSGTSIINSKIQIFESNIDEFMNGDESLKPNIDKEHIENVSINISSDFRVPSNSVIIRMRGLPWSATEDDIRDFLDDVEICRFHMENYL